MPNLPVTSLALLFFFATPTTTLPAGTALPVMLNTTLDAGKSKPGERIEGRLMQDVQASPVWSIKHGTKISGHIVQVNKSKQGSRIVLQFDQLQDERQTLHLNVAVRAIASMMSVAEAHAPVESTSNTDPENMWTVRQVGDATVNRGRGLMFEGRGTVVGKWTSGGVFAKLLPGDSPNCPATDTNDEEQSLWVFSPWACGPYELQDATIAHSGNTVPVGQVELKSPKNLKISGGSGWLLIANGSATRAKPQ